jgi:hypothetical protein
MLTAAQPCPTAAAQGLRCCNLGLATQRRPTSDIPNASTLSAGAPVLLHSRHRDVDWKLRVRGFAPGVPEDSRKLAKAREVS